MKMPLLVTRTFPSNKSRAFIYSKCRFSISKALSNVNNKGDDGVESGLFHWKQDLDEVGRINISGNIIPMVWFQAIRYPNGKPNVNAIIILADIVYWYRPTEIRDEITGQVVGRRKKFRDDLLQRSYGQISELFGLTKKQVVTAVNALEQMGVIKRNFRNMRINGQFVSNVLYLELIPQRLHEITYPGDGMELPVSTYKETGIPLKKGRHSAYKDRGGTVEGTTNTKITTEIETENYSNLIYPVEEKKQEADEIDRMAIYTQIIKENIDYDILIADCSIGEKEYIDEVVELITEVVAIERKTIRIAGTDLPYQLVKSKMLKLNDSHIRYVLECLNKNTTKVRNIKQYILTSLYNAPNTIGNYYRAEVNHDLYGGVQ